ncbi:hypothetical protein KKH23_07520 [Patescibacteria group bacterium]|nr:hypothetical protein [Patescibacteria group bacterium]
MVKIKEMYGYQITYNPKSRRFLVEDSDGTELAFAKTQDEIEIKAKALSKQEFKRFRIVKVGNEGQVTMGEFTSLNRDDQSGWISMEKGEETWGSGRQKIALRFDRGYYEATETNLKTLGNIKSKRESLNNILAEIKSLRDILEKPINLDYFGIPR